MACPISHTHQHVQRPPPGGVSLLQFALLIVQVIKVENKKKQDKKVFLERNQNQLRFQFEFSRQNESG